MKAQVVSVRSVDERRRPCGQRSPLARGRLGWRRSGLRAGYDAAYDTVRRYVHWRCGGLAELADDAVQETWLMAVRRIGNYEPTRGPFATWVCGIGGNVVRNALRSRRRLTLRVGALAGDCPAHDTDTRQDDAAERTARAWLSCRVITKPLCATSICSVCLWRRWRVIASTLRLTIHLEVFRSLT